MVLKDFDIVAKGPDCRLHQIKVDGRHLGAEKGVVLLHFLCKYHAVIGAGNDFALIMALVSHTDGRNEGADPDAGRAKVIHLVDFKHGVKLSGPCEDVGNLVCGNGVQTAAKGIELDQIQIVLGFYKAGCSIEAGMVHPLVCYH